MNKLLLVGDKNKCLSTLYYYMKQIYCIPPSKAQSLQKRIKCTNQRRRMTTGNESSELSPRKKKSQHGDVKSGYPPTTSIGVIAIVGFC